MGFNYEDIFLKAINEFLISVCQRDDAPKFCWNNRGAYSANLHGPEKEHALNDFFSFLIPQSTYFLEDPTVFFTSRHLMRAFYYPCFIFCQPARPRKRAFFQPTVIRIDFKRRDVLQKILDGGRIMLKKLEKKTK